MTFEQLHHHVREPVGRHVHIEDTHDVRAAEERRGPSLALEAQEEFSLFRELRLQDLDRERLAEPDVVGLEDDPHAALAEPANEAVFAVEHAPRRGHLFDHCHRPTLSRRRSVAHA